MSLGETTQSYKKWCLKVLQPLQLTGMNKTGVFENSCLLVYRFGLRWRI